MNSRLILDLNNTLFYTSRLARRFRSFLISELTKIILSPDRLPGVNRKDCRVIPEEVRALVGKTGDVIIYEIEKGAIKQYADSFGDFNPLYWDEEYARNSRYGSLIAPPGFFGWPATWTNSIYPTFPPLMFESGTMLARYGYERELDGGIEYEFFLPVRAGDRLAALARITRIFERQGKSGQMVFVTIETTYHNQNGSLVAIARKTTIYLTGAKSGIS